MIRRWSPLLLVPLAMAACGRSATVPPPPPVTPAAGAGDWVEETLQRMTLRQKVAQMVMPWVDGSYIAVGSDGYERLRQWVVEEEIGGIIMSVGPPLEIASKLNMLQEMAPLPLLVAADVERGPAQRLTGGTVLPYGIETGGGTDFPPIMALGAADDERLAYDVGKVTAAESRAVGIHMAFAPVVDVNNNPANPIINTRSFGEDPKRVARLAAAQLRGLQENGLLATAKHFPGHGNTATDSHLGLPVLDVTRSGADSLELVPFRAAIDAGVAAIMSAHIAFPAITGDTTPATLSPKILTDLLQQELGFRGLITTDALDMGGIVKKYGQAEATVMAIGAGTDLLLMPLDVPATIGYVVDAVRRGDVTEERIDRSVRKLLRIKAGLGLHERRTVELGRIHHVVGAPAHEAVAQKVAERAITLVRDRQRLIPVDPQRARRVLSIVYTDDVDPFAGRTFNRALAARFPQLRTVLLDRRLHPEMRDSLLAASDSADIVFFSSFIRVIDRKGGLAIAEPVSALVEAIAGRRPLVVASFGNPYVISQFPGVGSYLLAWGEADVSQRAAARALAGEIPITGMLPISLPPDQLLGSGIRMGYTLETARPEEVGMDAAKLRRVDETIEEAIAAGAAPGAALAVGRHGRLVRLQGYGRLDLRPGFGPVSDSSIYDLASLTKVIATTTAVMLLEQEGKLDPEAPVSRYLPEWRGSAEKERVTVRQLMTHTAGLPAYGPLWKDLHGREDYLRRIAPMELEYTPGTRTLYSDFGLILLGLIVEKLAGQSMDAFLDERVFGPLGMHETGYNPRDWGVEAEAGAVLKAAAPGVLARIAPTEVDSVFRETHLHGVVHDENAYAIGGVSGHAGLFSSARDLAVFAQMLLNGGFYGETRVLRPETIRKYTTRQAEGSSRALGWDTPAAGSSAGDYFSARSFGHTGFTGTSIWIDPDQDLFVVLLTNRVNPTRENQKHVALRRAVHDAVQLAITDRPARKRLEAALE